MAKAHGMIVTIAVVAKQVNAKIILTVKAKVNAAAEVVRCQITLTLVVRRKGLRLA